MTRTFEMYAARMPAWVAIGAVGGIICGIFFGELTEPLRGINSVYTAMMQVAAIPYLVSSILHGLASTPRERFLKMLNALGLVYLAVIVITFALLAAVVFALSGNTAPALVVADDPTSTIGLIERLIPTNIFSAAAQNYLPATILFAVMFGIAMQSGPSTGSILPVLAAIRSASVTIWQWVVLFAPFAVFGVMAHLAGTTPLTSLSSLSSYILAMTLGPLVLAFVLLPLALNALYPGAMRVCWPELRNGLLIAVTTSLSVAALPFIQRAVQRFLDEAAVPEDADRDAVIESTLALSYPMAQLGNFFVWVFIAFAFTYYRELATPLQEILLPIMVLVSAVGSPSTSVDAVAFLASWLKLPEESVDLYSGIFVVTRYFQVTASVMGFLAVTAGTAILFYRLSKPRPIRIGYRLCAIVLSIAAVGVLVLLPASSGPRNTFAEYMSMTIDRSSVDKTVQALQPANTAPHSTTGPSNAPEVAKGPRSFVLDRIQRRGVLRVGYNRTTIPFSFDNASGDPVGFDVEFAHALAASLNVELKLVPFDWTSIGTLLDADGIDIAAAGIYVTSDRLEKYLVSDPYYESSLAIIVPSDSYLDYLTRDQIISDPERTVTVFDDPVMVRLANNLFPDLAVKTVSNYYDGNDFDMALWTQDQAWAFALTDRTYTAVRPADLGGTLLFAYLIPRDGEGFHRYVNYWLRLQRENGFHARMVEKWIKASPNLDRPPRWSVLRNVLGVDFR